jgi:hypothetical protein
MRCLCGGPYPSIEQQAQTLRNEPRAPQWPIEHYIATVEAVNEYLIRIYLTRLKDHIDGFE